MHLDIMRRATVECLSHHSRSFSFTSCSTSPLMSLLSLPLVCPSNCGCGRRTLTTATRPSPTASTLILTSSFCSLSLPSDASKFLIALVGGERKPHSRVHPYHICLLFPTL